MPVFDFNSEKKDEVKAEATYEKFYSGCHFADASHPIIVLDNRGAFLRHHSEGMFLSPAKGNAFEYEENGKLIEAEILRIDARFENLVHWLGDNHIMVRLSGSAGEGGYAVYKI